MVVVGANGSGKTRLAAYLEETLGVRSHRIAAHRALALNPRVPKIPQDIADRALYYGPNGNGPNDRKNSRWQRNATTGLLNDFDIVLQALFAEQSKIALETHNAAWSKTLVDPKATKLQRLAAIWGRLLPGRSLAITADDIEIGSGDAKYGAGQGSDGERAVFYTLGQILLAPAGSLLIFDEPELHIHRSILGRLWDEAEAARPDCSFLLVTHDLDFASSRSARKFVIIKFDFPLSWVLQEITAGTGFSEETTAEVLGSRHPVLFIEGGKGTRDDRLYMRCFPDWTIVPCGGCETVKRCVAAMRDHLALHRNACFGIIDRDGLDAAAVEVAGTHGVAVLPVAEIENLVLLPEISLEIAGQPAFQRNPAEVAVAVQALEDAVLAKLTEPGFLDKATRRYCSRRAHNLSTSEVTDQMSIGEMDTEWGQPRAGEKPSSIAAEFQKHVGEAVASRNMARIAELIDCKAFFALAAKHLTSWSVDTFENWLGRSLRNGQLPALANTIRSLVPQPAIPAIDAEIGQG